MATAEVWHGALSWWYKSFFFAIKTFSSFRGFFGFRISLAFISQFVGIGLITWALGKVKTGLASLTLMSEPVTASFLAWFVLGEYLSNVQFIGGIVILFGIIYAQSSTELKN